MPRTKNMMFIWVQRTQRTNQSRTNHTTSKSILRLRYINVILLPTANPWCPVMQLTGGGLTAKGPFGLKINIYTTSWLLCYSRTSFTTAYFANHTIQRSCWVDHSLKIPVLSLQYMRAGHAKNVKNAKGMPFPMYGIFCLITFLSIDDPKF